MKYDIFNIKIIRGRLYNLLSWNNTIPSTIMDPKSGDGESDEEVKGILRESKEKSESPISFDDSEYVVPSFEIDETYHEVTLAWKELSVYVPIKKNGIFSKGRPRHRPIRRILNNSCGVLTPGSLLAIMGGSGSGKTTLLNALAHKIGPEVCLDGEILVNGVYFGKEIGAISGFVYQDDLFYDSLTVSEHLHFMARMKLDSRLGNFERNRRVEELLTQLGLQKCSNSRIKFISGGEKKRLSFGSEILTDPSLLFCDEPTTGLDSYSATKIVEMMKQMSEKGKTILCTIHQPSSQIFTMFQQLLLIADGKTAFMGNREEAYEFFKSCGFNCPLHFNPADFYIKTLSFNHSIGGGGESGKRSEMYRNVKWITDTYAVSQISMKMQEQIRNEFKDSDSFHFFTLSTATSIDKNGLGIQTSNTPGWFRKTFWLLWRAFIDSIRNPKIHLLRTFQKIILALIIGSVYFNVGSNHTQIGIQDIQGAIFLCITESTYPVLYGILYVFPLEMPLLLREMKSGLYSVDSYYISKTLSQLPGFIIDPIIFTTIVYWLLGFQPTLEAFTYTLAIIILCSNAAAACSCLFSASFDSISTAFSVLIPFDYILFIAAGLLVNLDSLSPYLSWVRYISWFTYTNEGMSIAQWKDVENIPCNPDPASPCINSGEGVLKSYSFASSDFLFDVIGLVSLILFFHFTAFISLLIKIRRK